MSDNRLTEREREVLQSMLEAQQAHAMRCDEIGNRRMAERQKARDLERVAVLRKVLHILVPDQEGVSNP